MSFICAAPISTRFIRLVTNGCGGLAKAFFPIMSRVDLLSLVTRSRAARSNLVLAYSPNGAGIADQAKRTGFEKSD